MHYIRLAFGARRAYVWYEAKAIGTMACGKNLAAMCLKLSKHNIDHTVQGSVDFRLKLQSIIHQDWLWRNRFDHIIQKKKQDLIAFSLMSHSFSPHRFRCFGQVGYVRPAERPNRTSEAWYWGQL